MKKKITSTISFLFSLCLIFSLSNSINAQTPFYTEDFADADLTGWTTVEVLGNGNPSSKWTHTTTGAQGSFPTSPINSSSAANGWIIFDSDFDCGISGATPQDSWIISPLVDATAQTSVFLRFQAYYRSFNDRPAIRVGTDLNDMSNWENIEMFPGIVANDFAGVADGSLNPVIVTYDLTAFAANENFYFAFQFLSTADTQNGGTLTGCGYSIHIDDIELLDGNPRPKFDMQVNTFFARAMNYATPKEQVEPLGFLADIQNVGAETQNNVNLTGTIGDNGTMMPVYTESLAFGNIMSDSLAENQAFAGTWTPPQTVASYTGTYEVQGDSTDLVPFNNTQTFDFLVTDSIFAKENGVTSGGLRYNVFSAANPNSGNDDSYMLGNHYHMVNGSGFELAGVTFGLAYGGATVGTDSASVAGRFVNIYLYKVDVLSDSIVAADRTQIGFASYTVTGGEEGSLITLDADAFTNSQPGQAGQPISFEDDGHYLIMGQVIHPTQGVGAWIFWSVNDQFNYSATILRQDVLGDVSNYGSFLGTGATATDGAYTALAGSTDSPAILHLGMRPMTVSVKDVLSNKNTIKLFPNPVNEKLNLDIKLEKEVNNLILEIVDLTGRTVYSSNYGSIKEEIINIDVNSLVNGTYFLTLKSALGSRTERFVIQK